MTRKAAIDETFIDQVSRSLANNSVVRRRLPAFGRVHIDRQQPFLCVYRKPAQGDAGTADLLLSQAAYILADGAAPLAPALAKLTARLSGVLGEAFGSMVLLEIWAAEDAAEPTADEASSQPARFRILAPKSGSPRRALDSLEKAIATEKWPGGNPQVAVDYVSRIAPPGLKPLITLSQAEKIGCVPLGIEVAPVYRDAETGALFPAVLRQMARSLSHVLKKTFFTFAHTRASYRPAHYHELGRRAMTRAVWDADRQLAEVAESFDLLLHLTPVNVEAAWRRFRRQRFERPPEFLYRPQEVDTGALKRALYKVPIERIEDAALHHLFEQKRDELDREITMLADRESDRALYTSLALFSAPEDSLVMAARGILGKIDPHRHDDKTTHFLDAPTFAAHARSEIETLRKQCANVAAIVQLRDDVPGLVVSHGHLLVGTHARIPKARLQATLQHEVGTHILTYYNGRSQPFHQLHSGMAGYEALQEGLAVLAEYLVGGLSRPRLRLLAGRVIAVDSLIGGADFIETFRLLQDEFGFSQLNAYMMAMRVFRGGGFTKDVVYLRGLVDLLRHLAGGNELEPLLIGKVALGHADLLDELSWRQVLGPPALRPRYLDDPQASARLARVARGLDVLDMIESDPG